MNSERLDATFSALADPTRRAILARLAEGETTVMELAAPFALTQPAISKHLKVLERAGLVIRGRDAQRRPCRLDAQPLAAANGFLERYRELWESSFERLGRITRGTEGEGQEDQERDWRKEREKKMKNTGTLQVSAPTSREIVLTRVFQAPRQMVFDAFSKPELLKRWFGPRGFSLVVCEVDFRVGGGFRFVVRGPDGRDMGMRGVYREIAAPERSVHTESFDDYPGESQVTTVLSESGGKTTMTATLLYPSEEIRDMVLRSGMEHGAAESYDKLAEVLGSSDEQGSMESNVQQTSA